MIEKIDILYNMWKNGDLGGEVMPEDNNPKLEKGSNENYLYFTLPMALNYQRNSYKMWEAAKKTYEDKSTNFVFSPTKVVNKSFEDIKEALSKYKLALQPNKQTEIWIQLCRTIVELYNGDLRELFNQLNNNVHDIKKFIQIKNKKKFPYLSGTKICNYWLYVIYQYTDREYVDIENLTIAPDTHVIQATHKLGIINDIELTRNNIQEIVVDKWKKILKSTKYNQIDLHTPLWLWSRNNFPKLEDINKKRVLIATSNNSKFNDFKIYIGDEYDLIQSTELNIKLSIPEGIISIEDNAIRKAKTWAIETGIISIGDDTGFFIPELNGEPGVAIRRWGGELGEEATNEDFWKYLQNKTKNLKNYDCYFEQCVAVVSPADNIKTVYNRTNGYLDKEKLELPYNGSGYPLGAAFVAYNRNKSWDEMTDEEKKKFDKIFVENLDIALKDIK